MRADESRACLDGGDDENNCNRELASLEWIYWSGSRKRSEPCPRCAVVHARIPDGIGALDIQNRDGPRVRLEGPY